MRKLLLRLTLICLDIAVLVLLFFAAQEMRLKLEDFGLPQFHTHSFRDFYFVIFIIVAVLYYEKIYSLRIDFWQETYKILKALVLSYFIVLAILMLQKDALKYSRTFLSLYFLLAAIFLPMSKRILKRVLYKLAFFRNRVLVIGDKDEKEILVNEFQKNWYLGLEYNPKEYDFVLIASRSMNVDKLDSIIEHYLDRFDEVYVVPYVKNINFANSNILEYSNIRYNAVQIQNRLLKKNNLWLKACFDYLSVFVVLPFFLVIHIFIAIFIKLDSKGPVFFRQRRVGKNGKLFWCYKYRTMYENSDQLLQNYLNSHPDEIAYYEKYHKYKNDPRITKFGKLLRTTSLDELPQIINVLVGDMSLVGPRPYMVEELKVLGRKKDIILKVKPGITGLWQVSGRNKLTFKERNELEIWYIKNWSLWSDIVILIKTVKVVFYKIGAK